MRTWKLTGKEMEMKDKSGNKIPTMRNRDKVEYFDDERDLGNGYIITLLYGWSFEGCSHEGVRGFDNLKEVRSGMLNVTPCDCEECQEFGK